MGIRLDPERTDKQKFPVVSWEEDRNIFAPDGIGPARVACFIRPDEKGVLQFVAAGRTRQGPFEEARPWEFLVMFEGSAAERHYYSAHERAALELLASKSKSGASRFLFTDGAHVMLANFADMRASVPMHLNCALASPVEVALLHDRLSREFIAKRDDYVRDFCDGSYVWPKRNGDFEPFVPPKPVSRPVWPDWIKNALIAAVLILAWFGAYKLFSL